MNKALLNKFTRPFGFEVHGLDTSYRMRKPTFNEDALLKQKEILGSNIDCIFDVGANRGNTVVEYRKLFGTATIHAFEPFPETFTAMTATTSSLSKIVLHQKAVADKSGTSTFYVNANVDTNSLLPSKSAGLPSDALVATKSEIQVERCTVEEICQQYGINEIDILKLDIQGGELAALKGCEQMLDQKRIKLIYTEAYFVEQYEGHPLFLTLYTYLHQHGYRLQDMYNPIYGKGSLAWCDAIFLPSA